IHLDLDVPDVAQWRSRRDQPGNGCLSDARGLGQKEVIGSLGLERPGASRLGQRSEQSIRATGAEEEGIGPGGRHEPHPGSHRGCCEQMLHRTLLSLFSSGEFGQAGCMVDWLSRFRPMDATMWRTAVDHGKEVSSSYDPPFAPRWRLWGLRVQSLQRSLAVACPLRADCRSPDDAAPGSAIEFCGAVPL